MKIAPITNNNIQNRNISHKGQVSSNLIETLPAYVQPLRNNLALAKTNPEKYPTLINFLEGLVSFNSKYAPNIIKNMQAIMGRFGRTCVLDLKQSEKNPDKKLFVIESIDSNYKHICGEIECKNNAEGLSVIDKFTTDTLAKINPYETNVKFMAMWQPHEMTSSDVAYFHENNSLPPDFADTFGAEKEVWFIEDELIDARMNALTSRGKSLELNDLKEYSNKLAKEREAFKEEFNS